MLIVEIQVDEPFSAAVNTARIEQAVATVLEQEQVAEAIEVGVLITDDATLHRLNRDYRGKDAPTDVLSFANEQTDNEDSPFVAAPMEAEEEPHYLGDIAISYERVCAQAAAYGHSNQHELTFLVVHAVLHLLGYDHERGDEDEAMMQSRERAAMQAIAQLAPIPTQ
jgi:probable rRNA maturation factor